MKHSQKPILLSNGFTLVDNGMIVAHHEVRIDDHSGLAISALGPEGFPNEVVLRRFTTAIGGSSEESAPEWRLCHRTTRSLAEALDLVTQVAIDAELSSTPEHAQDGMLHFAELEPLCLMDESDVTVEGRIFFGSRANESRVVIQPWVDESDDVSVPDEGEAVVLSAPQALYLSRVLLACHDRLRRPVLRPEYWQQP